MNRYPDLGRLIDAMVKILKIHQEHSMQQTMAYLSQRLAVSAHAIYTWREGKHKPGVDSLEELLKIGVQEAGMRRDWVEKMLYHGEFPSQQALLDSLEDALHHEHVPRHNLPGRCVANLVGRNRELTELEQRLGDKHTPGIVLIEGMGGCGKSTLALELGWRYVERYAQLPVRQRFDVVIWCSAQSSALTPQRIVTFPGSCTRLEDLYQIVASVLADPAIPQAPHNPQHYDITHALQNAGRVLLIIDGVESLDSPALLTLLRTLPATTTTVVTSRSHMDVPAPLRLQVLDEASAQELTVQECARRGVVLPPDEITHLVAETYGLPLVIWWVVGVMAMQGYGLNAALRYVHDSQADLLPFMFAQSVAHLVNLDKTAYHTLLALTLFDMHTGAAPGDIAVIIDSEEGEARASVQRLANLHLGYVHNPDGRFVLHPLAYPYAQAELAKHPEWQTTFQQRREMLHGQEPKGLPTE